MASRSSGHKQDIGWKHGQMVKEGDKVYIKCIYCGKVFKGGGVFRLKEHLAARKGGGPMCQMVPPDVRLLMQQTLDTLSARKKGLRKKVIQEPVSLADEFDSPEQTMPTSGTRQKKDLAWKYCQTFKNDGRVQIKCKYCAKIFKGGGIHRFKEHLAGRKGAAPICDQVPADVRNLMLQSLNEVVGKQNKKQKQTLVEVHVGSAPAPSDMDKFTNDFDGDNDDDNEDDDDYDDDDDDDDDAVAAADDDDYIGALNSVERNSNFSVVGEDGINLENLDRRKRGRGKASSANAVPLNVVNLQMVDSPIQMTIGRFLYDIGGNLDALDSIYYPRLIDMISSQASGVVAPSNHDLRGWILKNLVEEIKNEIDQYGTIWAKTGCSILVEEWNSESGRTMLNFLVDCSQATVFLKSVDVSHIIYSTDGLYPLLKQVVEEVGASHVLQVITNGDEHYNVAGKRLMDTFPSLYWAPCAARCIDLILGDFGKLEWINAVIEQAKSVTRFIYNHSTVLKLMRKFTFGKDILQQGITRSATNFTMLQRMADFKLNLQTMITSQEWMDCPYAKQLGGLATLDIIRMYQAKETIKRELIKREDYMVYWNIMDQRWDQQQHPPLHAAGFFLNPKFFYSIEGDVHNEILSRVFDCIERLVPDIEVQDKIVKELNLYKNAVGDLGRKMAIRARETLLPAEWWSTYAGSCPNLAHLALRIVSQTCSSIGCKHNHISFEKVPVDPVSFDNIGIVEDWIMQNDLCLEDYESSDWMSLVPPSANNIPLGPSVDEVEDWGVGFDDFEIFDGLKK
ncbi:hypothetical protein GH714_002989 [Hevea brasiliensis]|uniref:BED-type domain-containing protein n=1 Tax=Hevea brasiliensis TaxID=3981 RepID=A0A6A6KI80_HEVBR|nr:hypothetical protein GH714_002989 [Hevea brasiliensis]